VTARTAAFAFASELLRRLEHDEVIAGCEVVDIDPYELGSDTIPRPIRVALRGLYHIDVTYRGFPPNLEPGMLVYVLHVADGDLYEVLAPCATGSVQFGTIGFPLTPTVFRSGTLNPYDTLDDALASLQSRPGTLFVPPGEWTATGTYVISDSAITGFGYDASRMTFNITDGTALVLINTTIADVWLTVIGAGPTIGVSDHPSSMMTVVTRCRINVASTGSETVGACGFHCSNTPSHVNTSPSLGGVVSTSARSPR